MIELAGKPKVVFSYESRKWQILCNELREARKQASKYESLLYIFRKKNLELNILRGITLIDSELAKSERLEKFEQRGTPDKGITFTPNKRKEFKPFLNEGNFK